MKQLNRFTEPLLSLVSKSRCGVREGKIVAIKVPAITSRGLMGRVLERGFAVPPCGRFDALLMAIDEAESGRQAHPTETQPT